MKRVRKRRGIVKTIAIEGGGRIPGYDGDPPRLVKLRDPDGDGKRVLVAVCRRDRWQTMRDDGSIGDAQYEAAERFQHDWQRAEMVPYAASGVAIVHGSVGANRPSEAKLEAMRRYGRARETLEGELGSKIAALFFAAATERAPLSLLAKRFAIRRATATIALRDALDVLARHYGYA